MKLPDRTRLFDAVFDEEALAAVFDDIAAAIGARSYVGGFAFEDGSRALSIDSGYFTPEQLALYYGHYFEEDPWNAAVLADWKTGRARDPRWLVSDRQVEWSALYQEFFRSIGDDTFRAAAVCADNSRGRGAIAFQRGRDAPHYSSEEIAALDSIAPDLARIMMLRGSVQGMERSIAVRSAALDAVQDGLLIVDLDGRLAMANAEAERQLRQALFLTTRKGRLAACSRFGERALEAALSSLPERRMAAVRLPSVAGETLNLTLTLLPERSGVRRVMIAFPAARSGDRAQLLRQLYDLSASEAEIAVQLTDGLEPADIASARGTSLNTVRAQVRAIGEKFGCSRLIDIVRHVAALPRVGDFSPP